MHLSAIKLRGFKSFPDPVEISLEPGVAVVVGPNGSGKSNVSDAIVWASGSLAPSELRAEKPDDVLFAGSPGRPPAEWCEVQLLVDNSDGALAELPFTEVSITRRLHRGGEGEYLVNGASVRRLDVVELLADIGLGGGMHSIIGQGRVEAMLGSRPEERRALIEEAAGLGRFKQRRHRAELKLARVATEVERARDLEAEMRRRLRPLALQATAAERAERLTREIDALEAALDAARLAALQDRIAAVEERGAAARLARGRSERQLQELLSERELAERELSDSAGRRESATAALYRLRSARERLALRRETGADLGDRLRALLLDPGLGETPPGPSLDELERDAARTRAEARSAALEEQSLAEATALAEQRLAALERSLAEREGLPPAARALSESGEPLALALLEVDPGYERAVAAALAWRASALLAPDADTGFALVERARAAGLGTACVLIPGSPAEDATARPVAGARRLDEHVRARPGGEAAAERLRDVWLVPREVILQGAAGILVTEEGHRYVPAAGEVWYAGETAEAVLLELDARRRALEAESDDLRRRLEASASAAVAASERARAAAQALAHAAPRRPVRRVDETLLARVIGLATRLADELARADEATSRFEPVLRARVDAGAARAATLGENLRRLGGQEAELRRALTEAAERVGALDVESARLGVEAESIRRRLDAAGPEPAPETRPPQEELEEKLERLRRRRETLGRVNPLAKEEYEQERGRLDEVAEQRGDLERSLGELEQLRRDLTNEVERRFAETFAAVSRHFADVAATLFPGGEGRLRLTDGEAHSAEEGVGVEVELRPAGKRVSKLSLLSGGEKALGALAFVFALFLARPSPFYLLDEVEAALDDPNIGRFIELLRRYADRAQFIVITHQKRTMEAADTLYGVTMGADGVSTIVSRRVAREDAPRAVALAEA